MYRIGEFSILNQVTIKALRYYDEIGLFKPKKVDNFTGYRYYEDDQIEEFNNIMKYKELGFTLDEIKNGINEEEILSKIREINLNMESDKEKITILNNIIGGNNMIDVKYMGYNKKYVIGKRVTLENRNKICDILKEVEIELSNLNINHQRSVVCNFELGYESENIDAFIGFEVSDNEIQNIKELSTSYNKIENSNLEVMYKDKTDNFLISECEIDNLNDAYINIIKFAHKNNIQIRGWFTEVYEDNKVLVYVPGYDLNEINKDEIYHLNKFNKNISNKLDIDLEYIGEYRIREILPSIKYMFNTNKQKSMLDTKFKTLILNEDGSTNFDNIRWNKYNLLLKYDNIIIPLPMYKETINNKEYIEILMNETYENYKSQRPLEYLYEIIEK